MRYSVKRKTWNGGAFFVVVDGFMGQEFGHYYWHDEAEKVATRKNLEADNEIPVS